MLASNSMCRWRTDRTTLLTILQEDHPFPPADLGRRTTLVRRLARPLIRRRLQLLTEKIIQEDNAVCEHMQAIVHQLDRPQILGSQKRIAWFEENYADIVGDLVIVVDEGRSLAAIISSVPLNTSASSSKFLRCSSKVLG